MAATTQLWLPLGNRATLLPIRIVVGRRLGMRDGSSCNSLRISDALLDNINRLQITITENITGSLLGLQENELTVMRMNSKTSVSAHTN
jgi:hypothetical protein